MKSQTRLSVRSINQSNRSISVRLSFLFCLRVFISRSYENGSNHCRCKIHNFLSETDYNPGVSMTTHEMRQLHCSEKLATFSPEEEATSLNNVMGKSRICSCGNVCNL